MEFNVVSSMFHKVNLHSNKTNVYSVQLGEELTLMPNLRLKIGLILRGWERVIDLPPPHKIVGLKTL